jgi:hypothetical protein
MDAQLIAAVTIPSIAVTATVWKVASEVRVKRHVEITERFLDLLAIAHSRAANGRIVGASEQVAVMELIAAFGRRDRLFTAAASTYLSSVAAWSGESAGHDEVRNAARRALGRLPKKYREG